MRSVVPRAVSAVIVVLLGLLFAAPVAGAVVGGKAVDRARYPAVVTLAEACTATLIGADRLLTAGHCASYVEPGVTTVSIGNPPQSYVAARVARHPGFRYQLPEVPAEPFHDVALVELDRPVEGVAPMRISSASVRAGTRVEVVGYGTADPERLDRFGVLRSAALIVRGVGVCRRSLEQALRGQGGQFHGASMLCTQDPDGRRPYASGCNGDSGGPLLRWNARGPLVVGIDSWGIACGAQDGDPEVFVRMSHERPWAMATNPPWSTGRIRDPWDVATPAD